MSKNLRLIVLAIFVAASSFGQDRERADRRIEFPDVPGYLTLKCDLHQHTVFSDGAVWPDIRVQEAVRDGLDAISLTEHLEYQPHQDDIPHPDRNRSYHLALHNALEHDLLIIHGSEITRDMPPGHANAIFIQDANPMLHDDALEAFREARRQGAFIFWNHPNWTAQAPDGIARLSEMHRQLIADDLLDGIEVVNETTMSEEAFQIAVDHDLTIMGTSDIHGLVDWMFEVPEGGHRPVTLVFAKERTHESIREALFAGRTVAWFRNDLVGKAELLQPLLEASIRVVGAAYQENTTVAIVTIDNVSDASFVLLNEGEHSFHEHNDLVTLEAHTITELAVKTKTWAPELELHFRVLNALTAPRAHPTITLTVAIE
jgi:hypothetical protein